MTENAREPKPNPRRDRLARRLRELRVVSGLTQATLAGRASWVQPKVSRIEKGRQLPSEGDLDAWVRHTGAPREETDELLGLLAAARVEYTPTTDLVLTEGGLASRQAYIGAMEAAATRICEYQPAFVPGLLQTADYARAVMRVGGSVRSQPPSEETVEVTAAERIKRQGVLYDQGKRFQFVLGEAALWSGLDSGPVQAGQLDRLVAVAGLANVELSVVPLRAPMVVLTLSGFRLLDDEFVFFETLGGEQRLDDPEEVAVAVRALKALRSVAVQGAEAIDLIRRVAAFTA